MFCLIPSSPYSFYSLFKADATKLEVIQKARVRFDFNGKWQGSTFCYLDVNSDITRLFREKHFDYYGKNLINDLRKKLEKNPSFIKAVYLTERDLKTKIPSEIITSIQLRLPFYPNDSLMNYLSHCIQHSFGTSPFPGKYQLPIDFLYTSAPQKAISRDTRTVLRGILPSNIGGGVNSFDLSAVITSYSTQTKLSKKRQKLIAIIAQSIPSCIFGGVNNYDVSLLIREYAKASVADATVLKVQRYLSSRLPSSSSERIDISDQPFPSKDASFPAKPLIRHISFDPSVVNTRYAKTAELSKTDQQLEGIIAHSIPPPILGGINHHSISSLIKEYARTTVHEDSILELSRIISPHFPSPTPGGINRYDVSSIISEYFDEYSTEESADVNTHSWYGSDDINELVQLFINRELGGYREQEGFPCSFVLNKSFVENGENWIVALTPAVDRDQLSLPLGYFFDKALQPQTTLLTCYETIYTHWDTLEKRDREILREQLIKLLDPQYEKTVIEYLIDKLKEINFNKKKFENQLVNLRTQEQRRDLFDELFPFLQRSHALIKILIPYNKSQSHWLTAEVQIRKEHHIYSIELFAHDPYGKGGMAEEEVLHLANTMMERIKNIHPEAFFFFSHQPSPYSQRQARGDSSSCGVIVVEDILSRINGESLNREVPYPLGTKSLRQTHLKAVERYLPPEHPARKNFLERNTLLSHLKTKEEEPLTFEWSKMAGLYHSKTSPPLMCEEIDEEWNLLAQADRIKVDPFQLWNEKKVVKQNGLGLGLEQTAGALKILLKNNKDVHVVYSTRIGGEFTSVDNLEIAHQINHLILTPKWIVFPYAINHLHQIAIVISVKKQEMIVTDSFGDDHTKNSSMQELAKAIETRLGPLKIVVGKSNYLPQPKTVTSWECGVHAAYNILDQVEERVFPQQKLELDDNLETLLKSSLQYVVIHGKLEEQRSRKRKEKREFLVALETIRAKEGHFSDPTARDALKTVADALQMEMWGNLDRRKPDDHSGRTVQSTEERRDRGIEKLIEEYEKGYPEDIIGIIILNLLKEGGQFEEVIKYQRTALESGRFGFQKQTLCTTEQEKYTNLGNVFLFLGKSAKAIEYYQESLSLASKDRDSDPSFAIVNISLIGKAYGILGQHEKELDLLEQALKIAERVFGPNSDLVAIISYYLGEAYSRLNNYEKQIEMLERSLAIAEKIWGKNNSKIGMILFRLGTAYGGLNLPEKQIELQERALIMQEKEFGSKDYGVALILSSLGNAYSNLGQYQKQIDLHERSLEIQEKVRGFGASDIVLLVSLAVAYGKIEQLEKSKETWEKALEHNKKVFGEESLDFAQNLVILGGTYFKLGEHQKGIELQERALPILEKILEPESIKMETFLIILRGAYNTLRQYEKKKEFEERILSIREKLYGPESYEVAEILDNLGNSYEKLGQHEKQINYQKRALKIAEKVFGVESGEVCAIQNSLGKAFAALGNYHKQIAFQEQSLKIIGKELKDLLDYPQYIEPFCDLCRDLIEAYSILGEHQKQVDLERRCVEIIEKRFGAESIRMSKILHEFALACGKGQQYERQINLEKRSLEIAEKLDGPESFSVSLNLAYLGDAYGKIGKYQEQIDCQQRALAITQKILGPTHPQAISLFRSLEDARKARKKQSQSCLLS